MTLRHQGTRSDRVDKMESKRKSGLFGQVRQVLRRVEQTSTNSTGSDYYDEMPCWFDDALELNKASAHLDEVRRNNVRAQWIRMPNLLQEFVCRFNTALLKYNVAAFSEVLSPNVMVLKRAKLVGSAHFQPGKAQARCADVLLGSRVRWRGDCKRHVILVETREFTRIVVEPQ